MILDAPARERKIDTLYDAIKHGDEAHRAWLKAAIEAHFAGQPIPVYVARAPWWRRLIPWDANLPGGPITR